MKVRCAVAGIMAGVCGACGHPTGAAPVDAYAPYVTVKGGEKQGTWPNPMPIVFRDETGAEVTPEASNDGSLRARLPNGGSLELTQDNSASPTARSVISWRVNGLRPGDALNFDAAPPPLPDDCTADDMRWSVYAGSAVWNDADEDHAVARIAAYHQSTGGPPYDDETWTIIDGVHALSAPDGDALQSLTVVHCSSATYDDVRTIVGVAGWK